MLFIGQLGDCVNRYVRKNFAECVKTEGFCSWPLHYMNGLVSSDDLVVQNEEELLAAVLRWHRSAPGRDDMTAALFHVVRFPLLSVASLRALRNCEGLVGLPGIVASSLAAAALTSHCGPSQGPPCEPPPVQKRKAFPFWWADFGCATRGGSVVADLQAEGEEEVQLRRVHVYNGSVYTLSSVSLVQWPLGASAGRVIAEEGGELNGVGVLEELSDFVVDAAGDIYLLESSGNRVIKIRDGVAMSSAKDGSRPTTPHSWQLARTRLYISLRTFVG